MPGVLTPRRRWWVVLGVVVVVLALAGVQSVVDARARRGGGTAGGRARGPRSARGRARGRAQARGGGDQVPAELDPGGGPDVGEHPGRRGRVPGLHRDRPPHGRGGLVHAAARTGPRPRGRPREEQRRTSASRVPTASAAATWAVCTVTDGYSTFSVAGGEEPVQATTTRVAVLDTGDGHLLAEWAVEHDAWIGVLPGLVLVGLRRDGDIEIVAHDARTGAERWRHQDSPALSTSVPAGSWSFATAGDVVAYPDGDTADGALRGRRGRPHGPARPRGARPSSPISGTGLPALPSRATRRRGDLTETTTLLAARRRPRPRPRAPRSPPVDADRRRRERARPRADVARQAVRVGRGDRPAEVGPGPRGVGFDALVVRGRVFLCASTSVVALDGRTGDQVWEAEAPSCSYSGLRDRRPGPPGAARSPPAPPGWAA